VNNNGKHLSTGAWKTPQRAFESIVNAPFASPMLDRYLKTAFRSVRETP